MDKTNSLLSITSNEFNKILPIFDKYVARKISQKKLRGVTRKREYRLEPVNSNLFGSKIKLEFNLTMFKSNALQSFIGMIYKMTQS